MKRLKRVDFIQFKDGRMVNPGGYNTDVTLDSAKQSARLLLGYAPYPQSVSLEVAGVIIAVVRAPCHCAKPQRAISDNGAVYCETCGSSDVPRVDLSPLMLAFSRSLVCQTCACGLCREFRENKISAYQAVRELSHLRGEL